MDGRTLGIPLAWVSHLLRASSDERAGVASSRIGSHRNDLDQDIPVAGLLAGRGDTATTSDATV